MNPQCSFGEHEGRWAWGRSVGIVGSWPSVLGVGGGLSWVTWRVTVVGDEKKKVSLGQVEMT